MSKSVISSFQPSITEWFAALGENDYSKALREEDNNKTDRLNILHEILNLPQESFETFTARDLSERSAFWQKFLREHGDELCAIRLVPNKIGLPKLRQRGLSIKECYENWYLKQDINPSDYKVEVYSHSEILIWSAIFVVTDKNIYGEIIRGMHSQLTHGDTNENLLQFVYDFKVWRWSKKDTEAQKQISRMINWLHVDSKEKTKAIAKKLEGEFSHNFLKGYFEVIIRPGDELNFLDYNRLLGKYLLDSWSFSDFNNLNSEILNGVIANHGFARGKVRIVTPDNLVDVFLAKGEILVCDNTDIRFLPLIKKAGAVVTNRGGTLSHAAIVVREMKKPCIIGTKIATQVLHDGDLVEVDANEGVVKILKRFKK